MKISIKHMAGITALTIPFALTGCSTSSQYHLDGYGEERASYVQQKLDELGETAPRLPRSHSTYGASIGNHRHQRVSSSSNSSSNYAANYAANNVVETIEEEAFVPDQQWVPINVQSEETIPAPAAPQVEFRASPSIAAPAPALAAPNNEMLPPNARPGECYARVFAPPKYETRTERVLVKEGGERIEVIPAEYKMVQEQVIVEAESERIELTEAVYETRTERVMISPPSERTEEIPARYDTVEERVLVKPATTAWKTGSGPIEKLDGATGEIMCLVEVPAEYKTVTRQKLVSPASTRTIQIPAEYKNVTRKVMTKPPTTRTVKIPARFDTITVRKLVRPAQEHKIAVEPVYDVIAKEVKVSEGSTIWERVLCETNLTPDMITNIQNALLDFGYDPGTIDGKLGGMTQQAIRQFQTDRRLAVGGITYETAKHLGLEL